MNERLREAMRPIQYTEPTWVEPSNPEEGVDNPGQDIHRSTGGRDAVKPVGGISKDTSPLHYRRGRNNKPIDLEDDDYETQDEPPIGEEHF